MAVNEVTKVQSGGSDMQIFTSRPDGDGKSPAVIVIQEIFGVDPHIKDVTTRFAAEGFFAAAPELFHRAGENLVVDYGEMQAAFGERQKLSNEDIANDIKATVAALQANPNVDGDNIGIVGFCFGGMVSFMGATMPGVKASAVYYGGGIMPRPDAPADAPRYLDEAVDGIHAPIISFWGAEDGGIPAAAVATIESTLKAKGKSIETTIYDGAGHGFFNDARGSYNEAAAKDSWPKTVAFFKENLK
jgi:carboxymethylenebutenolidase